MAKNPLSRIRDDLNRESKEELIHLGTDPVISDVSGFIPTGWTVLDASMGGGLPFGRMVEVYGREAVGKSSLLYQAISECQRLGGYAILFDPEATFPKNLAQDMGIDLKRLLLMSDGVTLESSFEFFRNAITAVKEDKELCDKPCLIVWDTIAATPTEEEAKADGKAHRTSPMYRAQVIRAGLRKLTLTLAKSNVTLVILNHVFEKMTHGGFNRPTTGGGMGIKYHASLRVHLYHGRFITDKQDEVIGFEARAKIEKSKIRPPGQVLTSRFIYGIGYDDRWSIFDYGTAWDIISRKGSWYSVEIDEKPIKFYASNWLDIIESHPEVYDYVMAQVLNKMNPA